MLVRLRSMVDWYVIYVVFFFKQQTAYEMRISDWSSDVCSSDLREFTNRYPNVTVHMEAANRYLDIIDNNIDVAIRTREYEPDSNITIRRLCEFGRASCRDSACQYG